MGTFLQVAERDIGDITILQLKGQMVLDDGDIPLRKDIDSLIEHGHVNLVFDMRDISRLDSAGIGTLVSSYLATHRHGGTVKLLHVPPRAGTLLKISHLDDVFEIYDTEDAAMRSFVTQ